MKQYNNIEDIENDHPNTFIKYREGSYIYYFANMEFLKMALKQDFVLSKMAMANFVIDIKANSLVKCRESLEDMIENYITRCIRE